MSLTAVPVNSKLANQIKHCWIPVLEIIVCKMFTGRHYFKLVVMLGGQGRLASQIQVVIILAKAVRVFHRRLSYSTPSGVLKRVDIRRSEVQTCTPVVIVGTPSTPTMFPEDLINSSSNAASIRKRRS